MFCGCSLIEGRQGSGQRVRDRETAGGWKRWMDEVEEVGGQAAASAIRHPQWKNVTLLCLCLCVLSL